MSNVPPVQPPGFSNYPRSGPTPPSGGYPRPPGVYFEAIGEAWRIIQDNLGGWVVLTLCYFTVIPLITFPLAFVSNYLVYGNLFGIERGIPTFAQIGESFAINSLAYFVTACLHTGLQVAALRAVRGMSIGPTDLWLALPRLRHVLLGYFFVSVLTAGGTLLCLLPAVFVTGALAFVQLLIVDRNMSATEAIEASYSALKSQAWAMWALVFVSALLSIIGGLACGVGILFTFPIFPLTLAITYNYYFPPVQQSPYGYAIGSEPPR